MAIRSRGDCLSPLAEVTLLCSQGLKIHCKGKGAKAGSDGFSASVLGEMQDGGLCSSPAPGIRQMCSMAIRYKSIKIHVCRDWKSVVPLAHLNSQPLGESLLPILSL